MIKYKYLKHLMFSLIGRRTAYRMRWAIPFHRFAMPCSLRTFHE